jgi:protein TonB
MSPMELPQRNDGQDAPPASAAHLNEAAAGPSGQLVRLIVAPALVTVLLVGGVYWIRLQPPAGSAGQQQTSIVQVHLLPRPDPAPIAVNSVSRPITEGAIGRADVASKEPDPNAFDDPVPLLSAKAYLPAEAPPSNISLASPVGAPPSSAALKFQQTLLRHVARYQHYPDAARSRRLEGKVDTLFSMSRNGTLIGVWVETSSGQALLDQEAINTIRRAQPLPPIPPELPDRLNIHIPLAFDPP